MTEVQLPKRNSRAVWAVALAKRNEAAKALRAETASQSLADPVQKLSFRNETGAFSIELRDCFGLLLKQVDVGMASAGNLESPGTTAQ